MEHRAFDGAVRRFAAAATRRRVAGLVAVALTGGLGRAEAGAAKRCKRRLAACTRKTRCCGRKSVCATSHGAGSNTCCGGKGARCASDLTCCTGYLCEDGRCV